MNPANSPIFVCIKHVFLFYCFDIWDFTDPGETVPPRVSQFLETVKDHLGKGYFIQKPTNLEPPSPRSPHHDFLYPAPNTPRPLSPGSVSEINYLSARYQKTRDSLDAQSLPELFKLANPKSAQLAYSVLPIPSRKKCNKDSCPFPTPQPFCLLTDPGSSPCGPVGHGMSPPLGNCE